jgi:hypothetical protein
MITELAKSMQQTHRMFENPTLSAIEAMTKGLSYKQNLPYRKQRLMQFHQ